MTSINLSSTSEAKKTKATEKATVKKRKASTPAESSAPKKVKTLMSSYTNPIDVVPISSMPSKEIVPFGEEYVIPSESDEEDPSAATSEQLDEEIEVDDIPSTPLVSSPCLSSQLKRQALKKLMKKMRMWTLGLQLRF